MKPRPPTSLLLTLLASCSAMPWHSPLRLSKPEEVPGAIAAAKQDFEAGRTQTALDRVRYAREVDGLDAGVRDEVELLVERYADRRIEELRQPGSNPSDLADLIDLDLPQQLSVAAGLSAARLYLDRDRPYKAYRLLKKLETNYPRHHGRGEAGQILVDAGTQLAKSDGGWWLWTDREDGIEVLEFLVLTYPSERRCDVAFAELARMYEEDRDFGLAIQRHEELLFSHVDSSFVIESQARIPHLRLASVESPEYDRKELLRARSEIEAWLRIHAGHALEAIVRVDYADCLRRIVQSDLGVARFYRRVSQPFGARFHAARALEVARETGDRELIRETESFLRSLPEVAALPGEIRGVGDDAFSHDATDVRSALDARTQPPAEPDPKEQQKP